MIRAATRLLASAGGALSQGTPGALAATLAILTFVVVAFAGSALGSLGAAGLILGRVMVLYSFLFRGR